MKKVLGFLALGLAVVACGNESNKTKNESSVSSFILPSVMTTCTGTLLLGSNRIDYKVNSNLSFNILTIRVTPQVEQCWPIDTRCSQQLVGLTATSFTTWVGRTETGSSVDLEYIAGQNRFEITHAGSITDLPCY